jgi:serine/threonine-protein kinase
VRVLELARGGMGTVEVVLRKEGEFSRLQAVKRLLPAHRDDESFRTMFLDEARVAGLLRHPNVVSVIDVGEDDEGPYLVMDYVEGISLARLVRAGKSERRPLPIQLCLRVCAGIARGLHAAHELRSHDGTPLQLVHRDVSPQNVLVSYDGEVRVADFGIAKALGRASRTSTGVLKGKLGYMSPEQLRFHEPDRRSDLFAVGVLLFEMLSGERLYEGEGLQAGRRILEEPPPDIAEHRDDVPDELVELLFDLLAKEPDDRPATAGEVAARLDSIVTDLTVDEEPVTIASYLGEHFEDDRLRARAELDRAVRRAELAAMEPRASTPGAPRRRRVWTAIAVAAVVCLVAAVGALAWYGGASSATEPTSPRATTPSLEPPISPPPARRDPEPVEAAASDEETTAAVQPRARPRRRPRRPDAQMTDSMTEGDEGAMMGKVPRWTWD